MEYDSFTLTRQEVIDMAALVCPAATPHNSYERFWTRYVLLTPATAKNRMTKYGAAAIACDGHKMARLDVSFVGEPIMLYADSLAKLGRELKKGLKGKRGKARAAAKEDKVTFTPNSDADKRRFWVVATWGDKESRVLIHPMPEYRQISGSHYPDVSFIHPERLDKSVGSIVMTAGEAKTYFNPKRWEDMPHHYHKGLKRAVIMVTDGEVSAYDTPENELMDKGAIPLESHDLPDGYAIRVNVSHVHMAVKSASDKTVVTLTFGEWKAPLVVTRSDEDYDLVSMPVAFQADDFGLTLRVFN